MSPEQAMDDYQMNAHDAYMADIADLEAYRSAFSKPGMMVYLDGRNEHGTHVLPMLPCNASEDAEVLFSTDNDTNEQIMVAAEAKGFVAGDQVWVTLHFEPAQTNEYGQVELAEYWEFVGVNFEATRVLNSKFEGAKDGLGTD